MPKSYNYHKPSPDGLKKIADLRADFSALDDLISGLKGEPFGNPVGVAVPLTLTNLDESREKSLAKTNLETASMWANRASFTRTVESRNRAVAVALTFLETAAMWAIKAVVVNDPESVVEDPVKGEGPQS